MGGRAMDDDGVSRREFLQTATAAGIVPTLAAEVASVPGNVRRPVAISSANGLRSVNRAIEMIGQGADPLDAAIEGVVIVEEDPNDMTVGYGGLPNEEGVVE